MTLLQFGKVGGFRDSQVRIDNDEGCHVNVVTPGENSSAKREKKGVGISKEGGGEGKRSEPEARRSAPG